MCKCKDLELLETYRKEEGREIVGVNSWDDGGGVAEEGGHDVHQPQSDHCSGKHRQAGMSHGHDCGWKAKNQKNCFERIIFFKFTFGGSRTRPYK